MDTSLLRLSFFVDHWSFGPALGHHQQRSINAGLPTYLFLDDLFSFFSSSVRQQTALSQSSRMCGAVWSVTFERPASTYEPYKVGVVPRLPLRTHPSHGPIPLLGNSIIMSLVISLGRYCLPLHVFLLQTRSLSSLCVFYRLYSRQEYELSDPGHRSGAKITGVGSLVVFFLMAG